MAMSQEHGSTLQEVQQLMKKNQVRGSNQPTHSTEGADTIISFFFCSFFFFSYSPAFIFESSFFLLL